jgi:hypothetical protein
MIHGMARLRRSSDRVDLSKTEWFGNLAIAGFALWIWRLSEWRLNCMVLALGLFAAALIFKKVVHFTAGRMARSCLTRPVVEMDPYPPRLGDAVTVHMRTTAIRELGLSGITARLYANEDVAERLRRQNPDKAPFVYSASEQICGSQSLLPEQSVTGYAQFSIPAHGRNSFVRGDESVEWFLDIRVAVPGWPDDVVTFPVTVKPRKGDAGEASEEE